MKLDIQRFGGRGASSSNSKLDIEVGKTYVNKNGTTFKITGTKNGKYEFIEMGNKGIADETEIKRIMKEQGYKYENRTSSVDKIYEGTYQTFLKSGSTYKFLGWYKMDDMYEKLEEKTRVINGKRNLYVKYKTKSGDIREYKYILD